MDTIVSHDAVCKCECVHNVRQRISFFLFGECSGRVVECSAANRNRDIKFLYYKYICVCVFECQDLWCSSHQDSPQALLDSVGASGLWITAVMNHVGDVTKIINKFRKLCLMSDFNSS